MARVGLLEDNTRIAKLCATMLHYAGHEVTVYERAQECLQALLPGVAIQDGALSRYEPEDSSSLPVDVLILDLYLPDIPGLQVLSYLQAHPHTQALPLILCTAAPSRDVVEALDIVPQATFLEKPFKIQALNSAIANALGSVTS